MTKSYLNYNVLVISTVCLIATSVDVPLSWPSPMIPKLNGTLDNPLGRPITPDENAWIGSLVPIAAAIGAFPFGYLSDKFGRKIGLLCTAVPLIISFFTLAFGTQIEFIYFARIIAGLAMGSGYALLPIYLGEVSKDSNRGMISQAMNVFWALGNFFSYSTGPFLSYKLFNLLAGGIPTTFFVLFLILAPETPYYLVSQNKTKEATKSLMLLRGVNEEDAEKETKIIIQLLEKEESGRLRDLCANPAVRKAFVICMALVLAQELCGFTVIFIYLQSIFEAAHTKISSEISSLIISVFVLLSSFVNPFFIDRSGRRVLIIISFFGMFVSLSGLGAFFYIKDSTDLSTDPIYWLPVTSIVAFIFSFNFGISAVPWTLTSEMFPNNVKQVASTTISSVSWALSFVLTRFFNDLNEYMGQAESFWLFAAFCLVGAILTGIFVPETKGKSFGEIQNMLESESVFQFRERKKKFGGADA
ncbi:facilitated trehalose transporter Tret1 [Leptinotarsa decemlineata]|uniref:facilitated trehalose transporter Tret1 n=1 Tax=Leptinotarsa decemlineata TaxID=7539 RepID=UPI003D3051EF